MKESEPGPGSPGKSRVVLLLAIVFALGLTAGNLTGGIGKLGASSSMTGTPAFESFEEAWNLVHDEYVLPEEIDDTELLYGAARGMIEAVGDTGHSAFMDPVDAEAFRSSLAGELIGIGVRLEFEEDFPEVLEPIPGSPAEDAGIQSGDLIITIDGLSTERLSQTETGARLRGEEGANVTLELERPSDQSQFTVTLTRSRIELVPVEWALLPDDLMLIRLNEFSSGAADDLRAALEVGLQEGVEGIVLDLRGNPGGIVSEAREVANEFMPEGKVLYWHYDRDEDAKAITLKQNDGLALTTPVIVLVDRSSASASEIVASSLRDNDRAEVVGVRTFGTATVVTSFTLDDGSIAAIGTALWKAPDGEFARDAGIEPTIEVELPPGVNPLSFDSGTTLSADEIEDSRDTQLQEAMHELFPATETVASTH